jgi:hypothetical protein
MGELARRACNYIKQLQGRQRRWIGDTTMALGSGA